jgi:putative Mg2+ transporter-C (MgtC) family protein
MPVQDSIAVLLGPWSARLCTASILLRLVLAALVAFAVGWERASKRHSAGLRTFIVVTIAATAAMLLDTFLCAEATAAYYILPAAVLLGTANISVNSLLFSSKSQIRGLTTSAALWCCSVIGLALGSGFYTAALLLFILLLPSLALLPKFETYLKNRSNHFEIHLELKSAPYLQDFLTVIRKLGLVIDDIELNPAYLNSGLSVYTVALSIKNPQLLKYKTHAEIIEALDSLEYISFIQESHG